MNRRIFIGAAAASGLAFSAPHRLWAEEKNALTTAKIPSGQDRLKEQHNIGVSDTSFKVLTDETGGNLFVMEQSNHKKGGPPRHLHYNEEEYFYVIEGNYIVEVDTQRFELGSGDSLLAPRKVPHAWAFVGDDKGRLLISFAPANKMEAYFRLINQIRAAHTYADPSNKATGRLDATVRDGTYWTAPESWLTPVAQSNGTLPLPDRWRRADAAKPLNRQSASPEYRARSHAAAISASGAC